MNNMLYFCPIDLERKGAMGIKKKVFGQINAIESYGTSTVLVYRKGSKIAIRTAEKEDLLKCGKINLIKNLSEFFESQNMLRWSALYIRKQGIFMLGMGRFLKKIKKNKGKILVEIPTFPHMGEKKVLLKKYLENKEIVNMIKVMLALLREPFENWIIRKYADRIVTYSNDEKILSVPTICSSNGVDMEKIAMKSNFKMGEAINLIAVSTCYLWHGYDRMIDGLFNYYLSNEKKVVFHLVGDGEELEKYKKMVAEKEMNEYVIFYGRLEGEELERVYNKCDIAIDTLGRHRVGVFYNSTLKGKEYAAKGFPIVSAVETEFDKMENYPYYLKLRADESPFDVEKIVRFFENIYTGTTEDERKKISCDIRQFANEHFSQREVMQPIITYCKANIS